MYARLYVGKKCRKCLLCCTVQYNTGIIEKIKIAFESTLECKKKTTILSGFSLLFRIYAMFKE